MKILLFVCLAMVFIRVESNVVPYQRLGLALGTGLGSLGGLGTGYGTGYGTGFGTGYGNGLAPGLGLSNYGGLGSAGQLGLGLNGIGGLNSGLPGRYPGYGGLSGYNLQTGGGLYG